MSIATRSTTICFLVLLGLSTMSFGQATDPAAAAAVASGGAGYTRATPIPVNRSQPVQLTVGSGIVFNAITGAVEGTGGSGQGGPSPGNNAAASGGGTIDGLNTVATFDGAFAAQAGPSNGRLFRFTMMGNHPLAGGSTSIPASISTVSLTLLNADGSVRSTVPFAPFEGLTLDSPNFEPSNYRSGRGIQFADAVQRAQFFNRMSEDWHTTLSPQVLNRVTFTIPRFVMVRFPTAAFGLSGPTSPVRPETAAPLY